jgi:AcrR family transcriptional regulator
MDVTLMEVLSMANEYNIRQNEVVRESIFEALLLLMKEMSFYRISITDLAKKAGVSRMAYYRNYKSKQEVITSYLNEMFLDYFDEIKDMDIQNESLKCELFFHYFRGMKEKIMTIINSDLSHLILSQFDHFIEHIFIDDPGRNASTIGFSRYRNSYISGGLYNVLIAWIKGGLKESDKLMSQIIYELYGKRTASNDKGPA